MPDEDIIDQNFARQQQRNKHNVRAKHFVWNIVFIANLSIYCMFLLQLDTRGRNHKTKINIEKRTKKSAYDKKKKMFKKTQGAIQTSFCTVHFNVAVDLLLPHETETAQRKREVLSKSSSERQKRNVLMAMEVASRSAGADLLMRGWCHSREVSCGEYTNLRPVHVCAFVCVRESEYMLWVCFCVFWGMWEKGWCVCLFLVHFTVSTQTLSVYVGSRKLKGLRAEGVSPLRTGCLNSSPWTPCKQITWQQCILYIASVAKSRSCFSIFLILFCSWPLICSSLCAALKRGCSTQIMKKTDIQNISHPQWEIN